MRENKSTAIDKITYARGLLLPIESAHIFGLESLPNHHKDPFDRLLISQAIVEGAILISADPLIKQYPVKVEW